jgi:glycosyltransferase involved in cell wall biosynthesis
MTDRGVALAVVICTHSGDRPVLRRVLASLALQDLPASRWELILVFNGPASQQPSPPSMGLPLRVVRVKEYGLTSSRIAGFKASNAAVYVLVDDDTVLNPDFLSCALHVMTTRPEIGAAGGRVAPEISRPPAPWLQPSMGHLAIRDFGDDEIVSRNRGFGPWVPIGAGMIVRDTVAQRFCLRFTDPEKQRRFGRRGRSLQGGEDTVLAFEAFDLGLACGYLPTLRLIHVISPKRLTRRAIARLNFSLGRSHARVCREVNWQVHSQPLLSTLRYLWQDYQATRRSNPSGGNLLWLWQLGFTWEAGYPWSWENALTP